MNTTKILNYILGIILVVMLIMVLLATQLPPGVRWYIFGSGLIYISYVLLKHWQSRR